MSLTTFNAAMTAAGFNDNSTKITKVNLKTVLTELSGDVYAGGGTKLGLTKVYENSGADSISGSGTIILGQTISEGTRTMFCYRHMNNGSDVNPTQGYCTALVPLSTTAYQIPAFAMYDIIGFFAGYISVQLKTDRRSLNIIDNIYAQAGSYSVLLYPEVIYIIE